MKLKKKVYKKSDFKRGDFILYRYMPDGYIKGEIVEIKDKKALIEVAIPTKKSEALETEQFEVDYYDLIPFSTVFSGFENKKQK